MNVISAPTQFGQQFLVVQKIDAKPLRDAENTLPAGNLLQDLSKKPLAVFHRPLRVAGWTEVPSFT